MVHCCGGVEMLLRKEALDILEVNMTIIVADERGCAEKYSIKGFSPHVAADGSEMVQVTCIPVHEH